jgi:hypothetical protein
VFEFASVAVELVGGECVDRVGGLAGGCGFGGLVVVVHGAISLGTGRVR